uniref:Uncharacterized protein isoform X1 n=1 Tax=Nicotiana tabacum TaxID=4097 RepID=A0A1S4BBA3_TOBAC|nr:PREDICTED: uncharacterized protein LOC107806521 isoform X1 [Nicotiana tabacum]XP_016486182.1 PREDICTED: uncharacterized protein LOC107806521 isoform X1 [Nicotiana tabacum]
MTFREDAIVTRCYSSFCSAWCSETGINLKFELLQVKSFSYLIDWHIVASNITGMPKPKRYENFQNSIKSAPTSQGVAQPLLATESTPSHFDDAPQLTSFNQPTERPTPSGHVVANPILSDQTTTQQVPSARAASQHPPSRKRSGHVSTKH